MTYDKIKSILLDIEGTTSSISYVHDTLFPYARKNAEAFFRAHWSAPTVTATRHQIAADAGAPSFTEWTGQSTDDFSEIALRVVSNEITRLMNADVKATGLKQLQGLIWEQGYNAGTLQSHVYADVPPAIKRWAEKGIDTRIYSSGSIAAQRVFFKHTTAGDLTPFLRGHYDTTTGPKRVTDSYQKIAADIGLPAVQILFISDIPAELDAAKSAGMQTIVSIRPGNAPITTATTHARIKSFADITL